MANILLLVSPEDAKERILKRIESGKNLQLRRIRSSDQLKLAEAEKDRWDAYNADLLKYIFSSEFMAKDYLQSTGARTGHQSFPDKVEFFRQVIEVRVNKLLSVMERLELMTPPEAGKSLELSTVFLVHGHDDVRSSVARFLEKIGLRVVILEEQPSRGRTIIEQFEQHASVGFAVILITPDDVGASAASVDSLRSRARQNVIFELGFFCGALGRDRVCVLYKGEPELPSDVHGIIYVPLDSSGGWRLRVFQELEAAKMEVSFQGLV